jgi:glycosyltransferase involved in cell wall biosynthesis
VTAISVVLATRDRPDLLRGALASLAVALRPDDEVIVVDSASTDERVREVIEAAGVRTVRCDVPGASIARNAGWRAARNEIVAFIDDDVRVEADWVARIDEVLAAHPDVAFLTGRVQEPPGDAPSTRAVAIKDDPEPASLGRFTRGSLGQTANTAIRRVALERVGGFDELLGPGGALGAIAEDVDLYDRLLGADFVGRYDPTVSAYHVQWRGAADLVGLDWRYGVGSGYRLAKVWRLDRPRARLVARATLWDWGFGSLLTAVRRRWKSIVVLSGVRVLGMFVGMCRGLVTPIDDGHLVARRRRRVRVARP